jgi:hypothetical protein
MMLKTGPLTNSLTNPLTNLKLVTTSLFHFVYKMMM